MSATIDRQVAAVDLTAARRFFDLMAEGEPVTLQTFDDAKPARDGRARILHGDIDSHARDLQWLNGRGAGIFWMVNYGDGKGREAANVTGVRALFLDLDGAPLAPVLAAGLEPHAVIESSPEKWHVYWLVTGCRPDQFKALQQSLALRFGGDATVCDLPRVLRVPGFLHQKADPPFMVRIESLAPLQPYEVSMLVEAFGLVLGAGPKPAPRIDPDTGEIDAKVAPGGRHEHLVKWAAQLNWRGMPREAVRVALQAENLRACEPPKDAAEVDAMVDDVLRRYSGQHGRDLDRERHGAELVRGMASPAALRDAECYRAGGPDPDDRPPLDPLAALEQWVVTDEQVQAMKSTEIIWRYIIASTHLAAWIAQANGGKTTLAKLAAAELSADGFKVLYFQEDASAGDLPALHEHAQAHGYKLLNSTLSGSNPADQIEVLQALVRSGADLDGFVIFFDTLKKYADLMSKSGARGFFQLMRSLTQRGATIVLLGHTNKHKGLDGKMVFEGVGDVRNDVDELIYIDSTDKDAEGVVTLTMRPDKVRCALKEATFTLDTTTMEVRALDRVVDVAAIVAAQRQRQDDAPLIEHFLAALKAGGMNHTDLINEVMDAADVPRRRVQTVFGRYCSEDAGDPNALWLETRMRLNNTRYIALKPGAKS